jgi:hypothetical protein
MMILGMSEQSGAAAKAAQLTVRLLNQALAA